jgi:mRNA (2'-O-methyladenosine-N6-)-methyltransferase
MGINSRFLPVHVLVSYVDEVAWVKQTVNRRMAKGHGYYLQHAKETCLIGKKVNLRERKRKRNV